MGWWGIGDDDMMGDHPADLLGDAFAEITGALGRRDRHRVTLDDLIAAFEEILQQQPDLIHPAVPPAVAGTALRVALQKTFGDRTPVVRERSDRDLVVRVLRGALPRVSRSWQDTEEARPPRLRELVAAFDFVVGPWPERMFALQDPWVEPTPHHPLLGVPPATLDGLRARCDADAAAVLDHAARLSVVRETLRRPRAPGVPTLGSLDLLQALQAHGVLAALLDGDQSALYEADTRCLRAILAADTGPTPEPRLDPAWAGWVRAWLHGRPGTLDVAGLLGGIDPGALQAVARQHSLCEEGLVTSAEAADRLAGVAERLAGWSARRLCWGVHLDRAGELSRLVDTVRDGLTLIGTDLPERAPALIQAWACATGRPDALPRAWTRPASEPEPALDGQLWTFEPGGGRAIPRLSVSVADVCAARDSAAPAFLVATERALATIADRVAGLGSAPRVTLAPVADGDLLACWLAARVRTHLETGATYTLPDLLGALEAADEGDRRSLDWVRLAPWRAVPSRQDRPVTRAILPFLKPKPPPAWRRLPTEAPFYERYVQSEARLRALAALDQRLP